MPQKKCPKCGGQSSCYCQNVSSFSSTVLSYKYIFHCRDCGKKEVRVDIPYEIWSALKLLFSLCPFCGKSHRVHSRPPFSPD